MIRLLLAGLAILTFTTTSPADPLRAAAIAQKANAIVGEVQIAKTRYYLEYSPGQFDALPDNAARTQAILPYLSINGATPKSSQELTAHMGFDVILDVGTSSVPATVSYKK